MRVLSLFVIIAALACSRRATRGTKLDAPRERITDSVVLERTRCFGLCPAYRVRVGRGGEVAFVSHNPGEERLTALDSVAAWVVDSLTLDATRMDFFALPDSIVPGSPLCPQVATDHPTITIGVFGRSTKQVVYYTGCYLRGNLGRASSLEALGQLAARIDTLTGTNRWIHPGRSR
ncbi:MAG TPA: DUF6438 domain-containing protein [Gemmatimonadaceae bacterium]|jgi:hypothetical protein